MFAVWFFFVAANFRVSWGMVTLKTWKYDSDIGNVQNWEGGSFAKGCKGMVFAAENTAPVFVERLSTAELVLPRSGEIDLVDRGFIEFAQKPSCIKLKSLDYRYWDDFRNWQSDATNAATPHKEQIPCRHDAVSFPSGVHTRVVTHFDQSQIRIASMTFGNKQMTQNDMADLISKKIFHSPSGQLSIQLEPGACVDDDNCFCHDRYVSCPLLPPQKLDCLDPIQPEGFCHEICGAAITFKSKTRFDLADFKKQLKEKYSVDTYASRVLDQFGNDVIQAVFAESEYSGKSVEEATDQLSELTQSETIANLQFLKSGPLYVSGRSTSASLSIIFGTLIAVLLVFVVIFYRAGEIPKIPFYRTSSRSFFDRLWFARFDNRDENLIIDSQSMAGSVASLTRAFDNPMFGRGGTDASSTSTSTGASEDNKPTQQQHENPLYDIALEKTKLGGGDNDEE